MDDVNWCQTWNRLNSFAFKSRHFKSFMKDMKKFIPQLFKPCPFFGNIKLENIPTFEKFMSIVPSGKYLLKDNILGSVENFENVNVALEWLYSVHN